MDLNPTPNGQLPSDFVYPNIPEKLKDPNRFMFTKKNILLIVLAVSLAGGLVFGVWYLEFARGNLKIISPLGQDKSSLSGKNTQEPRNVMNPITGLLYTATEASAWVTNRPLGVMINNHPDARPQSGLLDADVVYEIVAEGGITRFLTFFLTNAPVKIGPVRSTREYYLVLVKELGDAMLMHIGYSPQALEDINTWPVRSLFQGGADFWRDNPRNVAIEHTAYVNAVDLRALGDKLGWGGTRAFDAWQFKDDTTTYATMPSATQFSYDYWYSGDFSVMWKYDPSDNSYSRYMGFDSKDQPLPHNAVKNSSFGEVQNQIKVKNVVVQFASEISIPNDDKNRLDYKLTGSGSALIFIDGKVIKSTWNKAARDSRTKFYDQNGKEVMFNRGNFWVSIVPDRNVDEVKIISASNT